MQNTLTNSLTSGNFAAQWQHETAPVVAAQDSDARAWAWQAAREARVLALLSARRDTGARAAGGDR